MSFFKFLFRKKLDEPVPTARAEQMLNAAKEKLVFAPMSPTENRYTEVKEETSVTGIYETVKVAMKDAIGEKKKATDAAKRVSSSVGTAGADKSKP